MLSIASRAPVSSPTPIIWVTIVGNADGSARIGVVSEPPARTDSPTASIALSMTKLPEVWPVMSIAWSIGTPAPISAEKVREKRARATFWTRPPIFQGIRSLKRSHCSRPRADFFHFLNPKMIPANAPSSRYG